MSYGTVRVETSFRNRAQSIVGIKKPKRDVKPRTDGLTVGKVKEIASVATDFKN